MTSRRHISLGLAALALFLFTPLARADTMTFDGIGLADTVKVHAPGHLADGMTTEAGQYLYTYKGTQYAAWCVDLDAYAATTAVTEESYTVLPNAYAVAYLYETYAGGLTSDTDAAALGVSIWEVITEPNNGGPFNVNSGSFWISDNTAVASRAAAMLATIPGSYTPHGILTVLHSDSKQDMLIGGIHQAPEPGTLVLLAVGGVLTAARRRRRVV
jgi:hypothetical protein